MWEFLLILQKDYTIITHVIKGGQHEAAHGSWFSAGSFKKRKKLENGKDGLNLKKAKS